MRGWNKDKLGNVLEIKYGKDHKKLPDGKIPCYGSGGIMRYVTEQLYDKESILIPRKGSLNNIYYINEPFWTVDTLFWSKINTEIVFPKFLFYQLTEIDFTRLNVGSAVPSLTVQVLNELKINLPNLPEQKQIAFILTSLDDKIDLLYRQNKTLEAMAETLFREWFVEGAEEDWEEKSLYNSIILIGGGTPKTKITEYWNGNIKWLSGGDISLNHKSIATNSEKAISKMGLRNSSAKLLPKFSTVISARGTVGKYCILSESMAFSQSNYGIKPKFENCFFFTYLLINHSVAELQAAAYGSVFDTITTNTFKGYSLKLPQEKIIIEFEDSVEDYFFKMLNNQTQIQTLENLRDTLLPKLMSGEIKVVAND